MPKPINTEPTKPKPIKPNKPKSVKPKLIILKPTKLKSIKSMPIMSKPSGLVKISFFSPSQVYHVYLPESITNNEFAYSIFLFLCSFNAANVFIVNAITTV